jgi:hypothetical protein
MFQNRGKDTNITFKSLSQYKKQNKLVPITQPSETLNNKIRY